MCTYSGIQLGMRGPPKETGVGERDGNGGLSRGAESSVARMIRG